MNTLHIVGSGAIGSLLAGGAQRHQKPYAIYPRNKPSNIPSYVEWIDGHRYTLAHIKLNKQVLGKNDILLLPLKVYQLENALIQWRPFLHPQTPVVLMHNGLGGYEIAQNILPVSQPLALATTSHGAMKQQTKQQCHLVYTGRGATQLGVAPHLMSPQMGHTPPWLKNVEYALNRVMPPVKHCLDIMPALWSKLAVNSVINPLTALHNVPNLDISTDQFKQQRQQLCKEFVQVANACGFNFNADEVEQRVIEIACLTGKNYSSMHQDVVHKRTTEIDAINGYLVNMAQKKGIEVPLNTLLVEQIKALT